MIYSINIEGVDLMYFIPYSETCDYCMMRQVGITSSFIRVLHASPDTQRVDVYANGALIARNIRYKEFTPYLRVAPGQHNITVYGAGTTTRPILNTNVTILPKSIYTAAAIGRASNLELYLIPEPIGQTLSNKANIRFVHLMPNAPAVDITTPDGKVLFPNINYKGITNYISVNPGKHNFQLRTAGTDNILLTIPNIILKPKRNFTMYAVGLADRKPGFQVLIPLDGNTYLNVQ